MFRKLTIGVAVLLLGATTSFAQTLPYPSPAPGPQPVPQRPHRFWVQFRQTYWRTQQFNSPVSMDAFMAQEESNGWQVQILPSPPGTYAVQYRLNHWAGSRIMPTLPTAQRWADYLADQGYEPRIVPYP